MNSISQHYDDLERALDDIRGLLDEWLSEMDEDPASSWESGPFQAYPTASAPPADATSADPTSADAASADASADAPPDEVPPDAEADPESRGAAESTPTESTQPLPSDRIGIGPSRVRESGPPGANEEPGRPSVIRYVQVVLHEWIANLIQHAEFGQTSPHVDIFIRADERHIFCSVTDNSRGFDLQSQLAKQRNQARALPERGMGLRFISACTTEIEYSSTEHGRHRFEFSIPVDHDPWLSMLF